MEKIQDMYQEGLTDEVIVCRRCHRRLKDDESKKLGYGKICYCKVNLKEKNYLFDIKGVSINE